MCISLDKKEIFDYISNFISGIVGALVIVFALGEQNKLNNIWLFISIIVLCFVGLIAVSFFKSISNKSNQRRIRRS
jgi:hypothetical protein